MNFWSLRVWKLRKIDQVFWWKVVELPYHNGGSQRGRKMQSIIRHVMGVELKYLH